MKKVLIVEDDERIRQVTKISLEMMTEWTIFTANCGLEAIKIAQKEIPDLILMDMMMPDLSGDETIEKLKENPQTQDINILLLTAKNNLSKPWEELGVKGLIKKPFDAVTLADLISEILGW